MVPDLKKQLKLSDQLYSKLQKLGLHTLEDIVFHVPIRYEDETHLTDIKKTIPNQSFLIEGIVIEQKVTYKPKKQLIAQIQDDHQDKLIIRLLHFFPTQLEQLSVGKKIRVFGEIRLGFYGKEMIHPKIKAAHKNILEDKLTPIYPTVSSLNQATLRSIIQKSLELMDLSETLPYSILATLNFPSFEESIKLIHTPSPNCPVNHLENKNLNEIRRLKFDELLAQQISMKIARKNRNNQLTVSLKRNNKYINQLMEKLPFHLTFEQKKVIQEIEEDLLKPYPMNRLLQGDVGSGKTIVSAICALIAIESYCQVAIIAPTEILAEQHYHKFSQWFTPLGIEVAWLSGSLSKKKKDIEKNKIQSGYAKIAVGTHALIQKDVEFDHLALIIIDEQHRFGVQQRLDLKNKGQNVHQLMMSATPIPRTLAMSFFADIDVSIINELPPNRTPATTFLINKNRRHEIEKHIKNKIKEGLQIYWVCPLIKESEALQLQTAVETYEHLSSRFTQFKIGLIHGRMKSIEKTKIMDEFSQNKIQLLVATTVIEVGVDVPNASIMVIEHAERMGLSQLHQLRGRVGRKANSDAECILLFSEPLSEVAKRRLKVIYENTDGFEIARQDLLLRGPGEFLGAKQSGIPMFKFADINTDIELLEKAQITAEQIIKENRKLAEKHLQRWFPYQINYFGS